MDTQTGKPGAKEEQVKGYETAPGEYIMLEPDEIAAAVPQSDKTLAVDAFIASDDIDDVYFDKPYYLAPDGKAGADAYALIRDGMRENGVAALAQTVLFRRLRTVLIRPQGNGLIATTLHFDYEIRRAEEAFAEVADIKIKGEMLELAEHIIDTKTRHVRSVELPRPLRSGAGRADQGEDGRPPDREAQARQAREGRRPDGGAAPERGRCRQAGQGRRPASLPGKACRQDFDARKGGTEKTRAAQEGRISHGAQGIPEEARFHRHQGAEGRAGKAAQGRQQLRHPETCRDPPAL